jgi:hypothetical protein
LAWVFLGTPDGGGVSFQPFKDIFADVFSGSSPISKSPKSVSPACAGDLLCRRLQLESQHRLF